MYDNDHGTRLVMLSRRMEIDRTAQMTPHAHGGRGRIHVGG
jgi:hypothetical protein